MSVYLAYNPYHHSLPFIVEFEAESMHDNKFLVVVVLMSRFQFEENDVERGHMEHGCVQPRPGDGSYCVTQIVCPFLVVMALWVLPYFLAEREHVIRS